jgi:hypothetical protein
MCCEEFAAHTQGTSQDGFRIWIAQWKLPYSVRTVKLVCDAADELVRSVDINFCPWCGHRLRPPLDQETSKYPHYRPSAPLEASERMSDVNWSPMLSVRQPGDRHLLILLITSFVISASILGLQSFHYEPQLSRAIVLFSPIRSHIADASKVLTAK